MATWYLDNDDEITDAVARLRETKAEHVVLVVPPGSRIATGRINFKLLAREAATRDLRLAVASPDEQVRALATSAGVITGSTPDQAQAALERGDAPPVPSPAPDDDVHPIAVTADTPEGSSLSWRSQRVRFTTLAALVLVVIAGYLLTQALPTADITLVPRVATIGPLQVPVVASAEIAEVDAGRGVVPATLVSIPLEATDSYPASGSQTAETRATGVVTFSALEQEFDQEIAAGTRVLTAAGTAFQTTADVTLPRADGNAAAVEAPIEALEAGDAGNVPAQAISVVPSLESQGIAVTNPEATGGGRFEQTSLVTAADYDAAAVDLRNRLTGELAAYLREPADAPAGSTVYPGTAVLGPVSLEPPAEDVVGRVGTDFRLAGSAVARVLAVDEAMVDEVMRTRLLAAVPAGLALLEGSVEVGHEGGSADTSGVTFAGTASARAQVVVDADELLERIAGLPVSEARAILDGLGTATVNVWPGFVGDLPNDRQRITLDVDEASATE